jgi:malate dehydrogenase
MKSLPKVTIIGAGNVGATTAMMLSETGLANITLFDVVENIAKAKALDLSHAEGARRSNIQIDSISNIKDIRDSDIIIITAGFPRKPGMSRDDLFKANADVVKDTAKEIKKNCPSAIVIVVTNPLDVMTYLTYKVTGFNHAKVLGMAGVLDSARLAYFIASKLKAKRSDINAMVLGSHGDLMVPVFTHTKFNGKPLTEILLQSQLQELAQLTKDAGAQIVSLLGAVSQTGASSAYYGPAASIVEMVKAILSNAKTTHCICAYLQGEYGFRDIYLGVPCVLGKKGIERIVELNLSPEESKAFSRAAEMVKAMIGKLDY